MLKINATYLNLLDRFRSTESTMEAIYCFHVRPAWQGEGIVMEALNGHRYGVFHDDEGDCDGLESVLIRPTAGMLKAFKVKTVDLGFKKKAEAKPVLCIEWEKRANDAIAATSVKVCHQFSDDTFIPLYVEPNPGDVLQPYQFPNTEGFLAKRQSCHQPDVPAIHSMAFPATEFGLFDFEDKHTRGIILHPAGYEKPCFVTVLSHPNFLGVIMPMCLDHHSVSEAGSKALELHKDFLPYLTLPTPAQPVTETQAQQ